jgi:hypothetical protein
MSRGGDQPALKAAEAVARRTCGKLGGIPAARARDAAGALSGAFTVMVCTARAPASGSVKSCAKMVVVEATI